jgi:hypothetical protein
MTMKAKPPLFYLICSNFQQQSLFDSSEKTTCCQPDIEFGRFLTQHQDGGTFSAQTCGVTLCICVCVCHGMSCRSRERLPAECARSSSEKRSLALLGTLRPMKKKRSNELQQQLLPRQQIPFSADQKVVRPGRASC